MNDQYDGDDRESRTAFRAYDTLSEPVSGRTPWQIWRDACAWQAARATPVDQEPFGLLETCKRLEESNAELAVQLQMTRKMHSDLLKQVLRDTTPADQEPASQEKFEWARKVYDVSESVPGELQRFWDCAVKSAGVKND